MESRLILVMFLMTVGIWLIREGVSDPQTNLLIQGCSTYNPPNLSDFYINMNGTMSDLRTQLSENRRFATAQRTRSSGTVYGMAQCRNYMPTKDCLACFDTAQSHIRNCSSANGARVVYDGCFLRYESNSFYEETTGPGNAPICGNQTASQASAFQAAVNGLLADLETATPRTNDSFIAYKKEVVGDGSATVYVMAQCVQRTSQRACKECLKIAHTNIKSCLPTTNGRAVDAGCFMRYSNAPFFANNETIDIIPFLKKGGSSKKKAIIGGVIGGAGLFFLIIVLFLLHQQSRRAKTAPTGDMLGAAELQGPVSYSYRDLKSATKNFRQENKLGEGGFGDVYKGLLKGRTVAVKKLFIGKPDRTKADFESEVKIISNVHHRNLLRLLGCCKKGSELLLVYEYMANSSLDKFLFGEKRGALNWRRRVDIIIGTARGLAYLHEEFHVCIIHRDIKCSNILLDSEFQPKIADFGFARLLPEDQTHISTKVAGTLGYTAPEYAILGQLTEKVDTYSYGVVILEIVSGCKCNEMMDEEETEYLLERAWTLYENDNHLELVDESLDSMEYEAEEVKKIIEIGLMCTQSTVSMRPTMSDVVHLLRSKSLVEHGPLTRPAFIDPNNRFHGESPIAAGFSTSNASVSISHFSGR